jgi:hypothetical protein
MAYTKAQLEAIKNTLLASNQPILASQHRSQIQSLIDEMYDGQSRGNILVGVQSDTVQGASDTFLIFRSGNAYQIPLSLFSATTLQTLGDVFITDLQNGDSLVYNLANDRWENQNILQEFALFNLIDVELTDPANGDILVYNLTSGKWENSKLNHNDLENIQGGDGVNYYHLSEDDFKKTKIIGSSPWFKQYVDYGSLEGSTFFIQDIASSDSNYIGIINTIPLGDTFLGIISSTDGGHNFTFGQPANTIIGQLKAIVWGNGIWIAISSGRTVLRSVNNGFTWTDSGTLPSISSPVFSALKYLNNQFVITIANTQITSTFVKQRVLTSPDGITWTIREFEYRWDIQDIVFGNGLLVVAAGSIGGTENLGKGFLYSVDNGVNWIVETTTSGEGRGIAYGNNIFVGKTVDGIYKSTNGISWDNVTTDYPYDDINNFNNLVFINGKFLMRFLNYVAWSEDGVKWEKEYLPFTAIIRKSINVSNSKVFYFDLYNNLYSRTVLIDNSFNNLISVSLDSQTETTSSRIDNLVLLATTSIVVIDGTGNEITGMNAGGISRKIVLINKTGDFLSVTNDSANSIVGNRFANSVSFPSNGATEWVYNDDFWYRIG